MVQSACGPDQLNVLCAITGKVSRPNALKSGGPDSQNLIPEHRYNLQDRPVGARSAPVPRNSVPKATLISAANVLRIHLAGLSPMLRLAKRGCGIPPGKSGSIPDRFQAPRNWASIFGDIGRQPSLERSRSVCVNGAQPEVHLLCDLPQG